MNISTVDGKRECRTRKEEGKSAEVSKASSKLHSIHNPSGNTVAELFHKDKKYPCSKGYNYRKANACRSRRGGNIEVRVLYS